MIDKNVILEVKNLSFAFPDELEKEILNNLSFQIKPGEIVGILGENGSGKTTLINLISKFLRPIKGDIFENPVKKGLIFSTLIFQEPALLEWKSVTENIKLSLLSSSENQVSINKKTSNMLRLLNLDNYKDKFPNHLSGGLKQRVAIARALLPEPTLLLMDEPFSALDIGTKENLIRDIRNLVLDKTVSPEGAIFITHNIEEALLFCDRIFLLDHGNISKVIDVPLPKSRTIEMVFNKKLSPYRDYLKEHLSKNSSKI